MSEYWINLKLNPERWAVGPLTIGRKGGKYFPYMAPNIELQAYQEAAKEALLEKVDRVPLLEPGFYDLTFYFWRRQESYVKESGRRVTKHAVDDTNLQKALEDACQGVLFDNDRHVRDIRSVLVEQGVGVKSNIVIHAKHWDGLDPTEIPDFMWAEIDEDEPKPEELNFQEETDLIF